MSAFESQPRPALSAEFEELKQLLLSDRWPAAVEPDLLCSPTSESDKVKRAEGIINLTCKPHLRGKNFLDMGCGEGHVVMQSLEERPAVAVGFDLTQPAGSSLSWEVFQNRSVLTTSYKTVKDHGPYDIVLLYDVLDHVKGEKPLSLLAKIRELTSPGARIYIRCHPWLGRHGGHLYQKLNKAFAHLIFSNEELAALGCESVYTTQSLYPLKEYRAWFPQSMRRWRTQVDWWCHPKRFLRKGLQNFYRNCIEDISLQALLNVFAGKSLPAIYENVYRLKVEDFFFNTPLIRKRITKPIGCGWMENASRKRMELTFVDYVLVEKR